MIRSFIFGILFLITCFSHAQVKIGFQAGYNTSKWDYTITPGNWQTTTSAISGFNAGPLAQFRLKNHIDLQGALLFNTSGTKLNHRYRFDMSSRTIKLYSLKLPVVAMYGIDLKKMRFGLGGGFYAAYMLSGAEKGTAERFIINGPPEIKPVDNKVEFGSADQPFQPSSTTAIHLNRFDVGYVVMAGIEFNGILILQASYNGGLRNVLSGGYSFSGNFKNREVSFSLAVLLPRKS